MSHFVRRHLNVEIDNFDRAIRDFVPGYETMLRVAAEQAAAIRDDDLLLELGPEPGRCRKQSCRMGRSAPPS